MIRIYIWAAKNVHTLRTSSEFTDSRFVHIFGLRFERTKRNNYVDCERENRLDCIQYLRRKSIVEKRFGFWFARRFINNEILPVRPSDSGSIVNCIPRPAYEHRQWRNRTKTVMGGK